MTLLFQQLIIGRPQFPPHRITNVLPMCPTLRRVNDLPYSLHIPLINHNMMVLMHYYNSSTVNTSLYNHQWSIPLKLHSNLHQSMLRLRSHNILLLVPLIPVLIQKQQNVHGKEIPWLPLPKNQGNSKVQVLQC